MRRGLTQQGRPTIKRMACVAELPVLNMRRNETVPTHERDKRMIYHVNRAVFKEGVSEEDKRHALDLLRKQGETIPAVKSFVVGQDLGGDFEASGVFVIEDLDGFWEYLTHPVHFETEQASFHLVEKFEAYDITDSNDPDYGEKIAALQTRSYKENPALAELISQVPSFAAAGDTSSPQQG